MTSTQEELTNLKADWMDSGLNWVELGDFTQDDINGLKSQWFPADAVKRGKLQSIWSRHERKSASTVFNTSDVAMRVHKWLKNGVVDDGVLRLEEGSTFPVAQDAETGMNVVIIRPTTLDLLDIFIFIVDGNRVGGLKHSGVLITGPPGDGKSFASQYFLWHFVTRGYTVVYENLEAIDVWVFRSNGRCSKFTGPANSNNVPELNDSSTIHLFDAKAGEGSYQPCASKARIAIFSSTNQTPLKQTERRSILLLGFVTPVVEEMKLAKLAFDRLEVNEVECVSKYGGNFRMAFAKTPIDAEYIIQRAARNLDVKNIGDVIAGDINSSIRTGSSAPTVLFSTFLDSELQSTLDRYDAEHPQSVSRDERRKDLHRMEMLIQMYRTSQLVWKLGSPYIVDLIDRVSNDSSKSLADGLIAAMSKDPQKYSKLGGMVGFLIERRAPELLAKGGYFKQRLLTRPNCKPADVTEVKLDEIELKHHFHKEVPNLEALLRFSTDLSVLHDLCGVFPGIDAMSFPKTAYQLTRQKNHPLNLETIANLNIFMLGRSEEPLEICFVVPHEVFDYWKREQSYTVHNVSMELKSAKTIIWKGQFQSGVLLADTISLNQKFADVSVALKDGNAVVTIADKTITVPKNRLVSPLKEGEEGLVIAKTKSGESFTLTYTRQINDTPFLKLSPELRKLLDGVTQKVICLPDVSKDVNRISKTARLFTGIDTPAQLLSKVLEESKKLDGTTSRSMSTLAFRPRPFARQRQPAVSPFLRVLVRCGSLLVK